MRKLSTGSAFVIALSVLACSGSDPGGRQENTGGSPAGVGGASNLGGGGLTTAPPMGGSVGIITPTPGTGGSAGEASCGVQAFDRERKPAEVILVLDRSASMQDPPEGGTMQKWEMAIPPLKAVIQATNSAISWGLKLYPESQDTSACAAETIVPLIHVPVAATNGAAVVGAIDATDPEGDGTPTGDAIKFAHAHLRERAMQNDNPKFILLATDGDPSCPSGDAAISYAVTNIQAALADGFPTFVIGVDTAKESSIERLNAMAEAGGRPRPPTSVNPLAPRTSFYLTSTQAELEQALQSITGELASCVFDLNPPPPVPENIAVDFSGQRTDRDPSRQNGWEYTNDQHTQLQVYGMWCDRIKNEAMNRVQIKYGCPNIPIPPPR